MAGKGGKGLIAAKTAAGMDKEKKQPVTRSSRAGLQVAPLSPPSLFLVQFVALSRTLRGESPFLASNWARRLRFVRS